MGRKRRYVQRLENDENDSDLYAGLDTVGWSDDLSRGGAFAVEWTSGVFFVYLLVGHHGMKRRGKGCCLTGWMERGRCLAITVMISRTDDINDDYKQWHFPQEACERYEEEIDTPSE